MSKILTKDDLIDLTGFSRCSTQIRALESMGFIRGVDFRVRPDGKPRMTWAALEPQKVSSNEPRFDLIYAKKA